MTDSITWGRRLRVAALWVLGTIVALALLFALLAAIGALGAGSKDEVKAPTQVTTTRK